MLGQLAEGSADGATPIRPAVSAGLLVTLSDVTGLGDDVRY
jgi:hypothetical protein